MCTIRQGKQEDEMNEAEWRSLVKLVNRVAMVGDCMLASLLFLLPGIVMGMVAHWWGEKLPIWTIWVAMVTLLIGNVTVSLREWYQDTEHGTGKEWMRYWWSESWSVGLGFVGIGLIYGVHSLVFDSWWHLIWLGVWLLLAAGAFGVWMRGSCTD